MKNFFLTLDLEEWYHLEYLKKYKVNDNIQMIKHISEFFDLLDKYDIKITVFVLGELADQHAIIIKDISNRGHEIACHGYDHQLLYNKTNEEFRQNILQGKKVLEEIINKEVIGYRASCFSMDNEKLRILKECGYKYDSSYIRFSQHDLYGSLAIDDFESIEDLVYRQENFFEFEIPTYRIFKYDIPISGGGYFRLFPLFLFNYMFNNYSNLFKNFVFYIHPFELTDVTINFGKTVTYKDRFRFEVGRKGNLKKFEKFIKYCKKNSYQFQTFSDYINSGGDYGKNTNNRG
ncbi:polysaccharide deacetylase family protein, PEP-CTERM locus subfamily [Anaerovirgula multivorans]|uniref:Polysaccharide deacetylase family protein, PEP-CTERM locus subfamily n=1 Tax=Anaerovirgula multivorans TaxID=312168 RepID=A0A239EHR5_9FIRM|nr:polysaccharide deacetylase family protein [Anaerovirgula multivorans]SNS43442.1 polysaccharide deacetylase family protein, PEP-CTERM locus subfamily [Anaerovirgula multivorans]